MGDLALSFKQFTLFMPAYYQNYYERNNKYAYGYYFGNALNKYVINMGNKWVGTDFLFTQYDGGLMSIQTPYEWLKAFCEEHGLVFRGIHCARHTFASHIIVSKMDIVQVSRTLGHTLPSTTLNIYSHLLQDASDDACNVAEDILSKKENPLMNTFVHYGLSPQILLKLDCRQ